MHPNPPRPSAAISSRLLLILQGSSPDGRESNCRHDAVPCVCRSALVLRSVRPGGAQAALNADANPCAPRRAQVTAPSTATSGVRSAARHFNEVRLRVYYWYWLAVLVTGTGTGRPLGPCGGLLGSELLPQAPPASLSAASDNTGLVYTTGRAPHTLPCAQAGAEAALGDSRTRSPQGGSASTQNRP